MKHPSELPPAFRVAPAPGITNAMCSPWPHTEWYNIVRVDADRWCLVNHAHTIATVGNAQAIAEALPYMPIPRMFLERVRNQSPIKTETFDLDLDELLKGL
jgi:hypothetical protein